MVARAHVVFGQSAAGSLREALAQLGRDERVLCEPDDLGYGPIDPCTAASRIEFIRDQLGIEVDPTFADEIDAFWAEVTATTATVVAWLSRRSVREQAGFLQLVSRLREAPWVVDVPGVVSAERMIEHGLIDAARPMSDVEVRRARATWQQLTRENAELRVLDANGLISAPITWFDELITSRVTADWQSCARVVGNAASASVAQTGDSFLWSRLCALVDAGVVEGQGDLGSMHASQVRRT